MLHEIKHHGFRILARKQGERVQVWRRRFGARRAAQLSNPPPDLAGVAVERFAELAAHLLLLERNMPQFVVAKMAIGARNMGHAPTQNATPNVIRTRPRYIGLRDSLKGPRVTSLRFAGEVGLISVPSRRNSIAAVTDKPIPRTMRTTPGQTSGKPGTRGRPMR